MTNLYSKGGILWDIELAQLHHFPFPIHMTFSFI